MLGSQTTEILAESVSSGFVYGTNAAIRAVNEMVSEIAPTGIPVLIVGESGTGKDAYARLLHRLSPLREAGFHKIDCASFDACQISSKLAAVRHAHSLNSKFGTLYLDNLHEMDLASQRALLSLLHDDDDSAEFGHGIPVRFASSTTVNLEREVESGRFRRELYFRLNGASLRLPPLRDRIEDVSVLAEYFLKKHSQVLRKNPPPLSSELISTFSSCSWPGNIRELENLVRQIVVFGDPRIAMRDFELAMATKRDIQTGLQPTSLKTAARAASVKAERSLILEALERTHWNRKRAARELQISYKSLLYKIKQIGVTNE
jgi:DNA-binding NtrC family response regulator